MSLSVEARVERQAQSLATMARVLGEIQRDQRTILRHVTAQTWVPGPRSPVPFGLATISLAVSLVALTISLGACR